MYKSMKQKTSQSIPPDPDSLKQAVLRANYQLYYWLKFAVAMIPQIPYEGTGWTFDESEQRVKPVWFTGKASKNYRLDTFGWKLSTV